MPAPTLADIVFSEQANHNFSKILGDLKKSNLSITNRLKSIQHDASFVQEVADVLGLPLVANERCGSWYIDPQLKSGSAYFKSTDGHTGQWKFSTRRLNFHLLEVIGKHDGCIIVDSTRRGKRMPDALSKTIPIWCFVLNRSLFPSHPSSAHNLHVPPSVVSSSEASQMSSRLPFFLSSLLALQPDLPSLRAQISKPLRPLWVTPDDDLTPEFLREIQRDYHPVICCTCSRRVVGTEMSEEGYIQGAGDDTENWAHGLTAPLFWANRETLLNTPEGDLPGLIEELVANSEAGGQAVADLKMVAPRLFVGALSAEKKALTQKHVCVVSLVPKTTDKETWEKSKRHMEVGLGKSKTASRFLREALPSICEFVSRFLAMQEPETDTDGKTKTNKEVVLLCESGRDLSVGVALALYCWCFVDSDGTVKAAEQEQNHNKASIRVKLGHIMTAFPDANPSRATLQSVNSFLMDWRK
ncbi:tRNA A64-2'-O-ribosylphosphate transferase [Sordaria brevicollis]|uniref:tRNA A64-2'-O-ribosylphosphate transferase n=1 Tax=Sordaria brevicollis TaxID=83679 RepID=A0AAE0PQR4_SORBR|nr:tRNA A64-2'-O-ribosylphosphate transferase [Sordaria brevicollis]